MSAETDSCDLSPQEVLFTFEEEWICYDLSFDVACKVELSLACRLNVLWFKVWK
jgi:hypothetical protein